MRSFIVLSIICFLFQSVLAKGTSLVGDSIRVWLAVEGVLYMAIGFLLIILFSLPYKKRGIIGYLVLLIIYFLAVIFYGSGLAEVYLYPVKPNDVLRGRFILFSIFVPLIFWIVLKLKFLDGSKIPIIFFAIVSAIMALMPPIIRWDARFIPLSILFLASAWAVYLSFSWSLRTIAKYFQKEP